MNRVWYTLIASVLVAGCNYPLDVSRRSVVVVSSTDGKSQGTGFVVDKVGDRYVVLTVAHVLAKGEWRIDGYKVKSGIVAPGIDVAILMFEPDWPYKPMKFAKPRPGQRARLVGFPGRLRGTLTQTSGHIMAVNRTFLSNEVWYDGGAIPGFSGGPIVDDWGRVLGMAKSHALRRLPVKGKTQWLCYDTALCCTSSETLRNILNNFKRMGFPLPERP